MSDSSLSYHKKIRRKLEENFLSTIKNALTNDVLRLRENRVLIKDECMMKIGTVYSPRCDVAVGPFSYRNKNYNSLYLRLADLPSITSFINNLRTTSLVTVNETDFFDYNNNPRCFMSIEVEDRTARDVKHLLGSMMNCSLMGKLGILVVSDRHLANATRLLRYLHFVKRVGKIRAELFTNVFVVPKNCLNELLQISDIQTLIS